jgi:hypothetical protein
MRWGRIVGVVLAVASLVAGGCSKDTGGAVGDPSSSTSTSSTSTSTSTTAPGATSTVAKSLTTSTVAASAKTPVAVAGDGFEVTSGSATRRYTYGGNVTVSAIKDAFRPHLGEPFKESDEQCDAGKLHWVRWKAVDVYFLDGKLAGWGLPPQGTPALKTAGGIGIGSSRPEVQRAFPNVTVEESTLGTEWFAAGSTPDTGLSGIFASDKPDALNESMWSGRTCLAR